MSAAFTFAAGSFGPDDLRVAAFQGREGISRLFRFDVTFSVEGQDEATVESALLGAPARLALLTHGLEQPRAIHGVVAAVEAEGRLQQERHLFRARLVPRLWLLRQRRASRIFQDLTVVEIVNAVLDSWSVPRRWQTVSPYPKRSYCVQYEETDHGFIDRILAEEGIFFWFEAPPEPDGKEVLVLCDSAHLYPPIGGDPRLVYRPALQTSALAVAEAAVHRFRVRRAIRPKAVLMRDFDFRRPLLELRADAVVSTGAGGGAGGGPRGAPQALDPARFEVYEHHAEYDETDATRDTAQMRLEQHRRRALVCEGESAVSRLAPGGRFSLEEHETSRNNRAYVVTRIDHEGRSPERAGSEPTYQNRFTCAAADVPFRPRARLREAKQVMETALVVGPIAQEIYTDALGRIKVQFHWDRDGRRDEHSSAWIRVAQAWAGAGFGAQFIPRVGMEVLVSFLGGDLDRPMVTGCVYNAINTVPFPLPEDKTRSGFRTRSSMGGGGANELSFEDKAGAEQVRVVAERDLAEEVKHDRSARVGNDCSLHVEGQSHVQVSGDRQVTVHGDLDETVDGARRSRMGTQQDTVLGDMDGFIGSNRAVVVHGSDRRTVLGDTMETFHGTRVVRAESEHILVLGSGLHEGHGEVQSTGGYVVNAQKRIHLVAGESILFTCGESSIELSPGGVVISGTAVTVTGTSSATLAGNGPSLTLDERAELVSKVVRIYSKKASIELEDNASVKGEKVLLNCDGSRPTSKDDSGKQETQPFSLRVTNESFEPYAGKRYQLTVEGQRFEGASDGDGWVKHDLPKEARVADLEMWIDDYPSGPRRTWALKLRDLPPPDTVAGAQERLKSLGYYRGAGAGEALDEETRAALRWFQGDHAIEETGALDGATLSKLQERYGH